MDKYIKEYTSFKEAYKDEILLFRRGERFETYCLDAVLCNQVLDTVTACEVKDKYIITWFPHYELNKYLTKLVRVGNKVIVIEALEKPAKNN